MLVLQSFSCYLSCSLLYASCPATSEHAACPVNVQQPFAWRNRWTMIQNIFKHNLHQLCKTVSQWLTNESEHSNPGHSLLNDYLMSWIDFLALNFTETRMLALLSISHAHCLSTICIIIHYFLLNHSSSGWKHFSIRPSTSSGICVFVNRKFFRE